MAVWWFTVHTRICFLRITQFQSRSKTNVSLFDSSRCCPQPCRIDYVQILWHGVFNSSLLRFTLFWRNKLHECIYCISRRAQYASNRPCYWTLCQIHPYLETKIMSIHSRLEVLCWQFPCRSFDRALSSSPCCGCQIYSVWVLLPNYFYFVPCTIHFFFMELSQSATKRIFSDGAAEAHIIGFILNSNELHFQILKWSVRFSEGKKKKSILGCSFAEATNRSVKRGEKGVYFRSVFSIKCW